MEQINDNTNRQECQKIISVTEEVLKILAHRFEDNTKGHAQALTALNAAKAILLKNIDEKDMFELKRIEKSYREVIDVSKF